MLNGQVGIVLMFVMLANRLTEALKEPLWDKYGWDSFWLRYVAWAIAGIFVAFTQINLFSAYIPNETIGMVLTAVIAGGGANLLHDLVE